MDRESRGFDLSHNRTASTAGRRQENTHSNRQPFLGWILDTWILASNHSSEKKIIQQIDVLIKTEQEVRHRTQCNISVPNPAKSSISEIHDHDVITSLLPRRLVKISFLLEISRKVSFFGSEKTKRAVEFATLPTSRFVFSLPKPRLFSIFSRKNSIFTGCAGNNRLLLLLMLSYNFGEI